MCTSFANMSPYDVAWCTNLYESLC